MLFSEMKARADVIGGEIKQADADVVAASARRDQAEQQLSVCKEQVALAIGRANAKRLERDALAEAMHKYVVNLGEETSVANVELKVANGV